MLLLLLQNTAALEHKGPVPAVRSLPFPGTLPAGAATLLSRVSHASVNIGVGVPVSRVVDLVPPAARDHSRPQEIGQRQVAEDVREGLVPQCIKGRGRR